MHEQHKEACKAKWLSIYWTDLEVYFQTELAICLTISKYKQEVRTGLGYLTKSNF